MHEGKRFLVCSYPYNCNVCGSSFSQESQLKKHVASVHKNKCPKCPKNFGNRKYLEEHMDFAHKPYEFEVSGMNIVYKGKRKHPDPIEVHDEKKAYFYDIAKKTVSQNCQVDIIEEIIFKPEHMPDENNILILEDCLADTEIRTHIPPEENNILILEQGDQI